MRLIKSKKKKVETEAQQFNKLMSTGKVSSDASKINGTSKGVLSLVETNKCQIVEQILIEKHPPAGPVNINI